METKMSFAETSITETLFDEYGSEMIEVLIRMAERRIPESERGSLNKYHWQTVKGALSNAVTQIREIETRMGVVGQK